MKVSILGAGRWGSTLAWLQNNEGREVTLWNRQDEMLDQWLRTRKNKYLSLPKKVTITSDLSEALKNKVIFVSVRAQHFRDLCGQIKAHHPKHKLFILAMKGLEEKTGKRLSQIFFEYFHSSNGVGVLAGPGHPQEIFKNIPTIMTCATLAKKDLALAVKTCQTSLIKIIPNNDLLGVEVGAAIKNVMGLAAGLLAGLGMPSCKSFLLARGPVEVGNLIKAMGGQYQTAFGLSNLGDFGATVFSGFSYNHQAGELWVKERKLSQAAEGLPTLKAVKLLMKKYKVKMPICDAVYKVFYQNLPPAKFVATLLKEKVKFE
ncbi:MAG: NAD(P)-binding domain-containing protein [Candidatus Komeilibacteria bacterium]|nr:NAD(P)-binding domain-containing protein [Candidatus Komeilibacteria bacterium]